MEPLVLAVVSVTLGLIVGAIVFWTLGRRLGRRSKGPAEIHTDFVFQRVRAVGRLVGLEVSAKEIATSTRGLGWMPPLILSQARVAMIFRFEKQYSVDLAKIRPESIQEHESGEYTLTLPRPEGRLRLLDVAPYDIQAGKVLGLLDVIPVGAATQKELMERAQIQAAELYEQADERYEAEAMHSIERQLEALLSMFALNVSVKWEPLEPKKKTEPAVLA
jgi:hypothetical protein